MRFRLALATALLAATSIPAAAQTVASADNAEMTAIYAGDQAPRSGSGATIDWSVVTPQDEARRARTRELLDSGAFRTGSDFFNAATVFQHGSTPADFMLAHTLAVVAAARGRSDAAFMAAASLDRYLQAVGHAQVYGTQYRTPDRRNTTQEPYDRTLVSDALRQALDVRTLAEQEVHRRELEESYRRTAPR